MTMNVADLWGILCKAGLTRLYNAVVSCASIALNFSMHHQCIIAACCMQKLRATIAHETTT